MNAAALVLSLLVASSPPPAQDTAERETDPLVLERLATWADWKFGFMVHWGPYSQWGVVESWTLCSEDEPWCRRHIDDYAEYRRRYEELPRTFYPSRFDPEAWAAAARGAGMRYVVLTTKHHDGFCMFDTRTTDYRTTGPDCAFSKDPRADVTREVFDAFRARGFGVGVYFSKPDWHSNDYWWRNFATPDRNVNYSIERYPERWARFVETTHRQVEELMTGYGPLDILWLDGGWVRPLDSITPDVEVWCKSPENQDIDMPGLAALARRHQPGLIVVDRTVHGRYENYRTPEQHVPEEPLPYPWETCMTMASQWSWKPGDDYKSVRTLVHLLIEIVAKGGNFLLNVGPTPEGELPAPALDRLAGIGAWMRVHGEAIHGTRPIEPHREGSLAFTARADGTTYAHVLIEEGTRAPATVSWARPRPAEGSEVHLLGHEGPLRWSIADGLVRVELPGGVSASWAEEPARVLRFRRAP